jgi:oligopeptide/dipeptide ABC transporter ATP-binding protein
MKSLLSVDDLAIEYITRRGVVRALDGASLTLSKPSVMGIVGESGSGKSTMGLAIGHLLPVFAQRVSGDLKVEGLSLFAANDESIRDLRRNRLGFVFQDPMTALNPSMKIGRQLFYAAGDSLGQKEANELLANVGLMDQARVAASYPYQLSGGMAQRVVIALAIARKPALLVADEPTASLDASLRDHILELLVSLRGTMNTGVILLSHELRVVLRHCDRVAVMYAGRIVEDGDTSVVFENPAHPYTLALLAAAPGREQPGEMLQPIPGVPPILSARATGCGFTPRCCFAAERCFAERPEPRMIANRMVLCHHAERVIDDAQRKDIGR